jgi:gliding motility-associated-like protein
MRGLIILMWFLGSFLTIPAQLVTSGGQSPQSLVQNVLVGNGVTVSNISFSGSPAAIGYFNGAGTTIGLQEGIIMTTGTIQNTTAFGQRQGPHGPNDAANAGVDNNYPGYGLLNNLLGGGAATYNASVLEFDFVPLADVVEFRYVFGSEEYPEYVGSQFNDVFAFFISGPGIAGNNNIARIPGTNVPVAINNVNNGSNNSGPCMNCTYYVNNGQGNNAPFNANPMYIQYDGFTKVLTATSNVVCGEKYHIIIAIADVGDGIYDSGIFLEANSFSSPVSVDVQYELSSLSFNNDYTMAEGCTDATITLTRYGNDLSAAMTIPISVSGTATMGTDYSPIPSSITFAANQNQVSFSITAFADGLTEGLETIIMDFGIPDPCGNSNTTTMTLAIDDVTDVLVTVADTEVECEGESATLIAVASGGGGGYNYLWSTGETTSSITVSPSETTSYTVTVSDNCLDQSVSATAQVFVPEFGPIVLSASDDVTDPCPYVPYTFAVEANGGAGGFQYMWLDNFGNTFGNQPTQFVQPGTSTTYYVMVEDRCGQQAMDSVTVTITSPPLIPFVLGDTTICIGDSALLVAGATGGYGNYYFYWPHSGETTNSVWVKPRQTGPIQVIVTDDCGTFSVSAFGQVEVLQPIANFNIVSSTFFEDLPVQFQNATFGANQFDWEFGDGNTSTMVHPSNVYTEPGVYYVTLYVENEIGCRDSITKPLRILPEFYIYVPNTITPNGDGFNDWFEVSTVNVVEFKIRIFNRWGEQVFYSDDKRFMWDATYDGKPVPDGVYVYRLSYISINGDDETIIGHVNVLR